MHFFDLDLYKGEYAGFLQKIEKNKKLTLVFTPNPEILYRAYHDREFLDILKHADYLVPDGIWLYLGNSLQEGSSLFFGYFSLIFRRKSLVQKYGELIKWADLTEDLLLSREKSQKNILILDRRIREPRNSVESRKQILQKDMKKVLEEKYPGTTISILYDGEMSVEAIAHFIQINKISIVFSCLGMKTQEQRLVEIWNYLPEKTPVVGLGVGASIDFLIGVQSRAPRWMQSYGLEWLYRLITQPLIRASRIWTAGVRFPLLVRKLRK